jgi:copper chaperone
VDTVDTKVLRVSGITCEDCVARIAGSVRQLPGVRRVSGNLVLGTVKVTFDPEQVTVERLVGAVEQAGGDRHHYRVEAIQ